MRYYIIAAAFLLSSCKKEEVQLSTVDSTQVAVHVDTDQTDPGPGSTPAPDPTSPTAPTEKGQQLMPVDEASKDADFLAFRSAMMRAVESRSERELMPLLDSNIKLSFGGSGGLADFRKMWKPQDKNSPLWPKLEWVLKHGGSFRGTGANRMFWAPYPYSNWPEKGPEPFEYGVIVGSSVPVFEGADASSKSVATLDHHFVKVLDGGHLREKSPTFVKIQTPSGKIGYVQSSQIRSQLDYRAGFDKRTGKWKMSIFIAGD